MASVRASVNRKTCVVTGANSGIGKEIARGLAGYDSGEAIRIAGHRTGEIEAILGYAPRAAMVHRDDMVVKS